MAHPGTSPEPDGDRPAAFDLTGDVWQRQGPRGTATWYCATRQLAPSAPGPFGGLRMPFAHGRTWRELDDSVLGPMSLIVRPALPDPAYTGPMSLPDITELVTDPIPLFA